MSESDAAQKVPADQCAQLLKEGYKYLDVRTPEEYEAGHIPDAVNIPFMLRKQEGMAPNPAFKDLVKQHFPDQGQKLILGCKSGNRSARACLVLKEDYTHLADNAGGFEGWTAANLPVTK